MNVNRKRHSGNKKMKRKETKYSSIAYANWIFKSKPSYLCGFWIKLVPPLFSVPKLFLEDVARLMIEYFLRFSAVCYRHTKVRMNNHSFNLNKIWLEKRILINLLCLKLNISTNKNKCAQTILKGRTELYIRSLVFSTVYNKHKKTFQWLFLFFELTSKPLLIKYTLLKKNVF